MITKQFKIVESEVEPNKNNLWLKKVGDSYTLLKWGKSGWIAATDNTASISAEDVETLQTKMQAVEDTLDEIVITQTSEVVAPTNYANFTSSNTYYSGLDVVYTATSITTVQTNNTNKTVQINFNNLNMEQGVQYVMTYDNLDYTISGVVRGGNVVAAPNDNTITWTYQPGDMLSMLHPYDKDTCALTNISILNPLEQGSGEVQEGTFINPEALANIGLGNLSTALQDTIGGNVPTTYNGNEIAVFNKILCVGDSLTAGVFNKETEGYATKNQLSYPAYLSKLTGCTVTNAGIGGQTAASWLTQSSEETFDDYDAAIIMLGVNDAGQGTTAENYKTALGNVVDKVKQDNDGYIKIFVSTTPPAIAYSGVSYNTINQAIREFVNSREDCYLLDLQLYGHTAREQAYNKGHLTALGYLRLAQDIKSYISYIINTNKNDFDNVQYDTTFVLSNDTPVDNGGGFDEWGDLS